MKLFSSGPNLRRMLLLRNSPDRTCAKIVEIATTRHVDFELPYVQTRHGHMHNRGMYSQVHINRRNVYGPHATSLVAIPRAVTSPFPDNDRRRRNPGKLGEPDPSHIRLPAYTIGARCP